MVSEPLSITYALAFSMQFRPLTDEETNVTKKQLIALKERVEDLKLDKKQVELDLHFRLRRNYLKKMKELEMLHREIGQEKLDTDIKILELEQYVREGVPQKDKPEEKEK